MKYNSFTYLLLFLFLPLIIQCKKSAKLPPKGPLLLSEGYRPIIEECRTNNLSDSTFIAKNLIGEWELVAYYCGGCLTDQIETLDWGLGPSATIQLTESKGTLDYKYDEKETILEFDWELKSAGENWRWDTLAIFYFSAEPRHDALGMYIFCDNYMYLDFSGVDGGLYLYEKQD